MERGKGTQALKPMSYFVYMLASKRNGTLYAGVTNDLGRRSGEHKSKQVPGFTKRHGVDILVWYEFTKISPPLSSVKNRSRAGIAPGKSG
jgi:hypothetical protein